MHLEWLEISDKLHSQTCLSVITRFHCSNTVSKLSASLSLSLSLFLSVPFSLSYSLLPFFHCLSPLPPFSFPSLPISLHLQDVEDLAKECEDELQESKASVRLGRKVDAMIARLDEALQTLEDDLVSTSPESSTMQMIRDKK